ncbi:MFS transporter [Gordonia jinhuaensis]|uniref:Major facilitator family transporter n=1 Tax=Gordonia jinhuaensis TaxID=1517702 RepID=A0A916TIL6_9ACTN|nr:major facilitator family transporter [Gordonia jinhuaensis]
MTSTATEPTVTRTHRRVWIPAAFAMFAIAWGGNEFTPLLVMYKNSHGYSGPVVDILLFAYVLGIVPALLLGGPLSDRWGRATVMRPAPVLAAIGSIILACGADSVPLLFMGRVFSGIALGLAMAVGSSWVKELSSPPFETTSSATVGAGRAAMSLTAGFGIGAGVAGVLAQWAPLPDSLSYYINAALCLAAAIWLRGAPETVYLSRANRGRLIDDLKVPSAAHRRFLFVVLPLAPWVFGAAASAYAVMPTLMSPHIGHAKIAYSALVTVVTLGAGFAIQRLGSRIDRPGGARGAVVGLSMMTVGMAMAFVASTVLNPWLTVVTGAVLGMGYGICLFAGLAEVQRIAGDRDLAGLTAVFYSLTYLGFAVPAVMAYLHQYIPDVSYPVMFAFGACASAACLVVIATNFSRHLD